MVRPKISLLKIVSWSDYGISRDKYVTMSKQSPLWIRHLRFLDSSKASEKHQK